MNERIVGWFAAAAILFAVFWADELRALTAQDMRFAAAATLLVALVYRRIAVHGSRLAVLERRRWYKELWRRTELDLETAEENAVVLLGRIRAAKWTTIGVGFFVVAALIHGAHTPPLIGALGLLYLTARLDVARRGVAGALPADADREATVLAPASGSGRYRLRIDVSRVHDFIAPPAALPFWTPRETVEWLRRCGFASTPSGEWEAAGAALRHLDPEEVLAIAPVDRA